MAKEEKLNPFKIAQAQLDEAAVILGLDEGTHMALRTHQCVSFMLPFRCEWTMVR